MTSTSTIPAKTQKFIEARYTVLRETFESVKQLDRVNGLLQKVINQTGQVYQERSATHATKVAVLDARIKLLETAIEKLKRELEEACNSHDERKQLPYSSKELMESATAVYDFFRNGHKHGPPNGSGPFKITNLGFVRE